MKLTPEERIALDKGYEALAKILEEFHEAGVLEDTADLVSIFGSFLVGTLRANGVPIEKIASMLNELLHRRVEQEAKDYIKEAIDVIINPQKEKGEG